ncbi:MAG: outer membrane beta-barrel protein [Flavobacteriales bacterium]
MKRKLITLVAALGMSVAAVAQLGPVSLGAEVALPTGDFGESYPLGYGVSLGYEQPIGEKLGVTLQAGYIMLGIDDAAATFIEKSSMMPIQVGAKYYLSERGSGIYAHVQGGVHNVSVTTKDIDLGPFGTFPGTTSSDSYLSGAVGVGYVLNKKIDVGVRYNIIAPDSDVEGATASNYLGFRLAYTLIGAGE